MVETAHTDLALENTWSFWYASRREEDHHIKYADRLVEISKVTTIKEFLSTYIYMKNTDFIERNNDIALFKKNYKPIWEACSGSACLFIRFKKSNDPFEIDVLWERLLFSIVGEQLDESILGAILSLRGRETIIELWFNYNSDDCIVINLIKKLKTALLLHDSILIYFKDNEVSLQDYSTIKNAQTFSFIKVKP